MIETYETEWYGEPVTACARCHFVQFAGESQHAGWCACPPDIAAALEGDGVLTTDQLRRFIAWEAGAMGLTYEQAVEQAAAGTLPHTALGSDVGMLLRMLDR